MAVSLLTNYQVKAKSIVELSTNNFFQRKWSNVYDPIAQIWKKNDRNVIQEIETVLLKNLISSKEKEYLLLLDTMPNFKAKSKKADDRTYEVLGGRGVPGYSYSTLCLSKGEAWSVPVSIRRVASSESKWAKGLEQIFNSLKKLPKLYKKILVGDSGYSNNKFITGCYEQEDLILITRQRGNRKVFHRFFGDQKKLGKNKK